MTRYRRPVTGVRRLTAVEGVPRGLEGEAFRDLLHQPRRDEHPVDFVRSLVDAGDARVAVHAFDGELARVSVAAEQLNGFVDDPRERFARPYFVDRALDGEAFDGFQNVRPVIAIHRLDRA